MEAVNTHQLRQYETRSVLRNKRKQQQQSSSPKLDKERITNTNVKKLKKASPQQSNNNNDFIFELFTNSAHKNILEYITLTFLEDSAESLYNLAFVNKYLFQFITKNFRRDRKCFICENTFYDLYYHKDQLLLNTALPSISRCNGVFFTHYFLFSTMFYYYDNYVKVIIDKSKKKTTVRDIIKRIPQIKQYMKAASYLLDKEMCDLCYEVKSLEDNFSCSFQHDCIDWESHEIGLTERYYIVSNPVKKECWEVSENDNNSSSSDENEEQEEVAVSPDSNIESNSDISSSEEEEDAWIEYDIEDRDYRKDIDRTWNPYIEDECDE